MDTTNSYSLQVLIFLSKCVFIQQEALGVMHLCCFLVVHHTLLKFV